MEKEYFDLYVCKKCKKELLLQEKTSFAKAISCGCSGKFKLKTRKFAEITADDYKEMGALE